MGGPYQRQVLQCRVIAREGDKLHTYTIFYKRHPRFTGNSSLNALVFPQAATILSDVVVMRMGRWARYVNMREGDSSRVNRVMAQ